MWRSLVAHHNGVVGVAGSNPVIPTIFLVDRQHKERKLIHSESTPKVESLDMPFFYFDHNATTPLCPAARHAWLEVTDRYWHNPSSLYREAGVANLRLEDLRENLADLLGCGDEPERVVFTSGATESNNAVMRYFASQKKRIAFSPLEHPSLRESAIAEFPENQRTEVSVDEKTGVILLDELRKTEVDLVSIMAANNETGTLQPWQEIRDICRELGVLFHCDAAQWIGKLPGADLAKHCDFVTGSAHKFGGPKGVGFLILPSGEKFEDFCSQTGGPQESRHRAGTEDLAGISAMVATLEEKPDDWLAKNQSEWAKGRDAFEATLNYPIIGKSGPRLWNTSLVCPAPHQKPEMADQTEWPGIRRIHRVSLQRRERKPVSRHGSHGTRLHRNEPSHSRQRRLGYHRR